MTRIALAALLLAAAVPAPESGGSRIVLLAPAAAEMLDALGLLERAVGIGEFGPWPAAVAGLPVVGGYDRPNVERVLELQADVVLTAASVAAAPAHERLRALGVAVLALDTSTYEGVFRSLEEVGRRFGRAERAAAVAARMRGELGEIERRARDLAPLRVLFVVGQDPLYVAGPGSHIDRLIALAGGRNVAHDALAPYQQLSLEAVLERAPDVIIDASDNRPGAPRGRHAGSWSRFEFLPAVRAGRVYQVDPSRLVIPGLRLPEMARLMGKLIHPERFGEPDEPALGAPPAGGDGAPP